MGLEEEDSLEGMSEGVQRMFVTRLRIFFLGLGFVVSVVEEDAIATDV